MNTRTSHFGLRALLSALLVLMLTFTGLAVSVSAASNEASLTSGETTTEYATVADALAAAKDGDTLNLLKTVTTEAVVISKSITVNLNGNTWTPNAKDIVLLTVDAAVKITDLSEGNKGTLNGVLAIGTGSLTLEGGFYKKGLDFGTVKLSEVIKPEYCVKVSGIPTAIEADQTKIEGNVQIGAHTYEMVSEGDLHREVCKCTSVKPGSEGTHTGGTATCIDLKKCEVCGAEYGDYTDHTFAWTASSTHHFEECTVCELEKNHEKHYGGTATCSKQAVCENANCGHGYGETLPHTPAGALVDGSDTNHWQLCTVCSSIANVSAHSYPAEWTVITEPTHDTEGLRERVCECGHKITKVTPVLDPAEFPAWAIVLIVILCALVAAVGVFALIWFVIKKKSFADLKAVFSKKKA